MTVTIDGLSLTLDEVVKVARPRERVELAPASLERMRAARRTVEAALARGDRVYGLTTGVGVLKRVRVDGSEEELAHFNQRIIQSHRVAQGPLASHEVVRAAMLRLLNGVAGGLTAARPQLALRLARMLNEDARPQVRVLGSLGLSDLGPNSDLAAAIMKEGEDLAAGEALALINNNSFSTGLACLALADASRLCDAAETAAALSLEAFAANLTILHEAVGRTRPYPGLAAALKSFRDLLRGSYLWEPGAARELQDPTTFRDVVQVHGALRDALGYALGQLAIELNASQSNPLVLADEDRVISVANFDSLPLAAALDFARIAMAPALTSSAERVIKLLETPWSGLPTGLVAAPGSPDSGLSIHAIADEAIVAEARLLAQPVSFELVSSAGAEGIEDRATMAPLAARRLADVVALGERALAIELLVAAQAVELRGAAPLGNGTAAALRLVRECTPFMGADKPVPIDLEPLRELVASGRLRAVGA
jgi:histidine ammonia-lyase